MIGVFHSDGDPVTKVMVKTMDQTRKKHRLEAVILVVEPSFSFRTRLKMAQAALKPYRHLSARGAEDSFLEDTQEFSFSSEELAEQKKAREGCFCLIPKAERAVVFEEEEYFVSILKNQVSSKRYEHSLSVAKVCEELALAHGIDLHQARCAGWLHDITKEMNKEEAQAIMDQKYPEAAHLRPSIFHEYTAPIWIKENLQYTDPKVLQAIRHHVVGDCPSPLAQILFIADKIEPLRGYDNTELMSLAKRSLPQAVAAVKKERHAYLEKVEGIHGN